MICPVCGASRAQHRHDSTGAYIQCGVCERHIILSNWTCPACSSQDGIPRVRNGEIEVTCEHCNTKDHYRRQRKVEAV